MGWLQYHGYAVVDQEVVSVHVKCTLDTNLLSMSAGRWRYELQFNGTVVDSHEHGTFPKGGVLCGILPIKQGQQRPIKVNLRPGWFSSEYRLWVDGAEVPLTEGTEEAIKEMAHRHLFDKSHGSTGP